jgi:glycine oxidase
VKVIIIGGGIIGASIARRLARECADVIVLERARLGQEASWAAAGMIAPQAEAQTSAPAPRARSRTASCIAGW